VHDSEEDRKDWEIRRKELEKSEIFKGGRVIMREFERGEMGE